MLARSEGDLNDGNLVDREAKRVYLYSEADRLVRWEDVEGYAKEAGRRGWGFVGMGRVWRRRGTGVL